MPRIRSLKPEHKQHRKVGMLSHRQYRLWVGMVTEADDDGRLVADAEQLRVLVFAYHPSVKAKHVAEDMAALAAIGLVRLYRVGDTPYAEFPSWRDHQKVSHPLTSKLPAPPFQGLSDDSGGFTRSIPEVSGGFRKIPEPSRNFQRAPGGSDLIGGDQGGDRKGGEGSGEGRGSEHNPDVAVATVSISTPTETPTETPTQTQTNGSDPPLPTITREEELGLPFIAIARRVSVAQARSELLAAKLRALAHGADRGPPACNSSAAASHDPPLSDLGQEASP